MALDSKPTPDPHVLYVNNNMIYPVKIKLWTLSTPEQVPCSFPSELDAVYTVNKHGEHAVTVWF